MILSICMEKIRKYLYSSNFICLLVIALTVTICSILFAKHMLVLFPDKGREFLFPEMILNGAVPYKDFTLIYMPLSFYINALLYKIFGVSFNTLLIFYCILAFFYTSALFLISREFLDKKTWMSS